MCGAELSSLPEGKLGRADADFVKSRTGYSIGGVSPVAHAQPPPVADVVQQVQG